MGLFGKLFEKKECSICGGEIGLLGNRKLEDGNMCKECAAKLSPYLTDRRGSTVAEIKEHLAYREANQREVAAFRATRVYGNKTKLYIDDNLGKFFITRYDNWGAHNPDLIRLSQVTAVDVDIDEHKSELYTQDKEGKRVSYNPRRYEYSYEFGIKIHLNSDWIGTLSFELSDERPQSPGNALYRQLLAQGTEIRQALRPGDGPVADPFRQAYNAQADDRIDKGGRPSQGIVKGEPPIGKDAQVDKPAASFGKDAQPDRTAPLLGKDKLSAKAAPDGWICSCGTKNTGNFCMSCGARRPAGMPVFKCDKCGWKPENPNNPPRFCPQCGDPFDAQDIVK